MPAATIGSGSHSLMLVAEEGASRPDELTVELRAQMLSASAVVYALEFNDLAEFFDDLVTNWRGWTGARTWRSLEGDLEILAEHHGHVLLRVALRGDPHRSDWLASATIELDPGEELSAAAKSVRTACRRPFPGLAE